MHARCEHLGLGELLELAYLDPNSLTNIAIENRMRSMMREIVYKIDSKGQENSKRINDLGEKVNTIESTVIVMERK